MAPNGGEVDKVPPQIIEFFPANGTINYSENYFEVTFSKYVDKRSVIDAMFISPSMQYPLKYDWGGKTLTVYFKDTLKQNTTYTITIGTDVKDLHNGNKMAESFSLAFSTGAKIDKGKILGKVYDQNPEGVMVFAFRNNGNQVDASKQKPDYISQVGKNGKYMLQGVGDGSFYVFAIRDKYRDYKYQKNEDEYGVQSRKIELNESAYQLDNIDFFLTMEDTIAPKVTKVLMKDNNHLLVELNKAIDTTRVSAENFYAFDSTINKKILPKYFYKGDARVNQYYLCFTDSINQKVSWVMVSDKIPDTKGNFSVLEKTPFSVKNVKDTLKLMPKRIHGSLPDDKIDFENPNIEISFNNAVDTAVIKNRLSFQDAKGSIIGFNLERLDDALIKLNVKSKLKQSSEYVLKIDLKNFMDVSGNKIDSLFKQKLFTSNELDFSGASGNVSGSADSAKVFVVLESADKNKQHYEQPVDKKKTFDFKKVIPGKYLLWGFKDKNNNGKYDHGYIKPFSYSEEFRYYPDTLNLRARWPVGDINFSFGKN